jgi:hypothetical protein
MSGLRLRICSRVSAAALGIVLTAAFSGSPARAQFFGWGWQSPQAPQLEAPATIYRRLLARGFDPIAALQRNGGVYLADVRDRYGRRERLVVDAYSGAILQTFAFGPPRPPASIPEPYAPGPAYAYRYAPGSIPPEEEAPGFAPSPRLSGEASRERRMNRKLARREASPKKTEPKEETPSQATREPNALPSQTPVEKSAVRQNAVGGSEALAQPVASKPVRRKPSAPANGPGYANGVPINPLD